MKLFEQVIERVEQKTDECCPWKREEAVTAHDGFGSDTILGFHPDYFYELYVNSEYFRPGEKLRITVERVEEGGER